MTPSSAHQHVERVLCWSLTGPSSGDSSYTGATSVTSGAGKDNERWKQPLWLDVSFIGRIRRRDDWTEERKQEARRDRGGGEKKGRGDGSCRLRASSRGHAFGIQLEERSTFATAGGLSLLTSLLPNSCSLFGPVA